MEETQVAETPSLEKAISELKVIVKQFACSPQPAALANFRFEDPAGELIYITVQFSRPMTAPDVSGTLFETEEEKTAAEDYRVFKNEGPEAAIKRLQRRANAEAESKGEEIPFPDVDKPEEPESLENGKLKIVRGN